MPTHTRLRHQFYINTRKTLELGGKSIYCVGVMKRRLDLRTILILGTGLMIFGAMVARWETERYREDEYAKFSNQSIQLAWVFSRGAGAWLVRGNDTALEFATNLMLAGSGEYVRITLSDEVILDERMDDPEIEALDLLIDPKSYIDLGAQSALTNSRLDVVVPMELSGQGNEKAGVVQIGFSDTYARAQVRSHRILIFGSAAGSWLILMMITVFVARSLSMKYRLSAAQSLEVQADGIIHCGALEIDTETCAVQLFHKNIELTPKMFELLAFLARNDGKTFSDDELLASLWEDAPYAASGDVKQCIYMLRHRLSVAHPDPKRIIVNVKGFGYKLEPPTEASLNGQ